MLVFGIIILIAVSIVTYNRISMEKRLAVEPRTTPPVQAELPSFSKQGEITFIAANNNVISRIDIEIADTDSSRARGLMYRTQLAESQGMLFIFPDEQPRSFWMHNTPLPLDMIFVNANGQIVTILKNTAPFDDSKYDSPAPAKYVIEVNAGYTEKYHITVGDRIRWTP